MHKNLFIPASVCLMRSALWPQEKVEKLLVEPDWIKAILHLYATDALLQEAVAVASPTLFQALQEEKGETHAASLFKYAIRMAKRATPFGLFSFVAPVEWGEKAHAELDLEKVEKKARPDMAWLWAILQASYENKSLFPDLTVQTNQLVERKGGRYVLSYVRYAEREESQKSETFFIRATSLIATIFELARQPTKVSILCRELLTQMPNLDVEKTENMLQQLVRQQFLLPGILPSLLTPSVFDTILPHLPQSGPLDQIVKEVATYEQTAIGKGTSFFTDLRKNMHSIMPTKALLQVDSFYTETLTLPSSIGSEICQAAELLWTLSPRRSLSSAICAYHGRFMEKYGTHRTIPLIELLSEEKGLGPFRKDETASQILSDPFKLQWEKWLHREWETAVHSGKKEIFVPQNLAAHLYRQTKEKPTDPKDALVSMDVFFKIAAPTLQDINEGNYLLEFVQPSWHGGSAMGRFCYLLDDTHQNQLRRYFDQEEELEKNTLFMEVSCWPQTGSNANVSTHPCLRKYRLDLQDKSGTSLSLEDIYVGATADRLYLTLQEGGKEIVYRVSNFLNSLLMPNAFQLMREISLTRFQLFHPPSWGFLENRGSFLPRLRFQKTILSPAQWNCDPDLLSGDNIEQKFTAWANQWELPRCCFLIHQDQHLLVDRKHPASLKEIVSKIKKREPLRFVEEISQGWIKSREGSHLAEFSLPILKNPLYATEKQIAPLPYTHILPEQRLKMPGNDWLYVKIYLENDSISLFLKEHIVALADEGYEFFFVRYADPLSHLRLRLKVNGQNNVFEQLNIKAAYWMKNGIIQQFAYVPYEREIERYGGPDLMDVAETLFCEDSLNVLEQLLANIEQTPLSQTLSCFRFLKGFGLDALDIKLLLEKRIAKKDALQGFREHKKDLLAHSQEILEQEIFDPSKRAFSAAASTLPQVKLYDICSSMLHMHFNRLGCSRREEDRARMYALHTLLQREHLKNLQTLAKN